MRASKGVNVTLALNVPIVSDSFYLFIFFILQRVISGGQLQAVTSGPVQTGTNTVHKVIAYANVSSQVNTRARLATRRGNETFTLIKVNGKRFPCQLLSIRKTNTSPGRIILNLLTEHSNQWIAKRKKRKCW